MTAARNRPGAASPAQSVSALEALVFLAELVLLAAAAVAGASLLDSIATSIVLAIALPVALAIGWGRWLAPRAPRRLAHGAGTVAKVVVFTAVAVLLAVAGLLVLAIVFWVVTAPVVLLAERRRQF